MNDNIATDEISLYDLIQVLKRRKFILWGIILAGLLIISGIYFISPISYKSEILLKIGKIADLPLERFEDLDLYCQKNAELSNIYYLPSGEAPSKYFYRKGINIDAKSYITLSMDKKRSSSEFKTIVLNVTSKGKSYENTVQSIKLFEKMVINRHNEIYNRSILKFNKLQLESDKNYKEKFEYLIESYSYPSERLDSIITYQVKMGIEQIVTDDNKAAPVFHMGLCKYLVLSIIGFAFLSVITVFILDFILTEIKKKNDSN